MRRMALASRLLLLALLPAAQPAELHRATGQAADYLVTRVRRLKHEGAPWTQGLEFSDNGMLVETSGDYPAGVGSFVREVDPKTGVPRRTVTEGLKDASGRTLFVEGITERGGHWYATTYQDNIAVEYDANFQVVGRHPYNHVGWGLSRSADGQAFLATNGSEYVMQLSPQTWQLQGVKMATCQGKRLEGLNELEMVEDFDGSGPALIGNLINTRLVMVMSPHTMACTGVFHLEDLEPKRSNEPFGYHIANGVAYDARSKTFFVTGKNWESIYEIKVSKGNKSFLTGAGGPVRATRLLQVHLARARSALLEEPRPALSAIVHPSGELDRPGWW